MEKNSIGFQGLPRSVSAFFKFKPKMKDERPKLAQFVDGDGKIPIRITGVAKVNGNKFFQFHPEEDSTVVDTALASKGPKGFFTGIDTTSDYAHLLFR